MTEIDKDPQAGWGTGTERARDGDGTEDTLRARLPCGSWRCVFHVSPRPTLVRQKKKKKKSEHEKHEQTARISGQCTRRETNTTGLIVVERSFARFNYSTFGTRKITARLCWRREERGGWEGEEEEGVEREREMARESRQPLSASSVWIGPPSAAS